MRSKSPINRPPILGQKVLTSRLERIIRPQVLDCHGRPSKRINTGFLNVLENPNAIEAATGGRNDGVMHDLESDAIDQIVRHNLSKLVSTINTTTTSNDTKLQRVKLTRSCTSPLDVIRNASLKSLIFFSASARNAL